MWLIIGLLFPAILVLCLCCYGAYKQHQEVNACKRMCLELGTAIVKFTELCNPGRIFTIEEEKWFIDYYSDVNEFLQDWKNADRISMISENPSKYYTKKQISENAENVIFSKNTQLIALSDWTRIIKIPRVSNKVKYRNKIHYHYQFTPIEIFLDYHINADQLRTHNNEVHKNIKLCNEKCPFVLNLLESKFPKDINIDSYFTFSQCQFIISSLKETMDKIGSTYSSYPEYISFPDIKKLLDLWKDIENKRHCFNHSEYIPTIVKTYSHYFDSILKYPLDEQQRAAIVVDEDNTLVISSAGSGKTSTIIGKAKYLLEQRGIQPDRLLILTYTRKAASELVERLENNNVDCTTFHSLAVRIIANVTNRKPSISDRSLLYTVFHRLLNTDEKFLKAILHYILKHQSLMKLEHDYDTAADYLGDRKKYGIMALYPDCLGNAIFTRSEEEKRICTYLTQLGVDFLYEAPYEYETWTRDFRQYKPDFTIIVKDIRVNPVTQQPYEIERRVYLEHFAIDSQNQVPLWFGDKSPTTDWQTENRKYNEGIKWKRQLHTTKGTVLIETRSADFHANRILNVLVDQLTKANVPIKPVSPEELYARLIRRSPKIESSVFKLLEQFIALLKANCGSIQPFIDRAKQGKDERNFAILNDVVKPLLIAYTKELDRRGEMDFTDAITKATVYCSERLWRDYDYILVDEFQDISVDRYHFLQSLRNNHSTKLFCVGDDWQSIYRFAGSNMKLFYKFEEYFGYTEHCKIETTYRFFNPLLKISSDFIQRNPEQLKKNVKSNAKPLPKVTPLLKVIRNSTVPELVRMMENEGIEEVEVEGKGNYFTSSDAIIIRDWIKNNRTSFQFHDCGRDDNQVSMLPTVTTIVQSIPADESILILGRYIYDIQSLGYNASHPDFAKYRDKMEIFIAGRRIRFMSVHAAKGLEADNVILINCNEGIYGFPSLIEDDPILSYVLSEEDQFEYAEERRLFYVALTRARRHLHVLYNTEKPSPFVRELCDVLKVGEHLCPVCREGRVLVLKQGTASNGSSFVNYGCSNYGAGCEYFERVFGENTPSFLTFNENRKMEQESYKNSGYSKN